MENSSQIKIDPLLSEQTYSRLIALRATSLPQRPASAFMPVSEHQPDILFIGQASSGMLYEGKEQPDYQEAVKQSTEMLAWFLESPRRKSFWSCVHRIKDQVERILAHDIRIGWSNLCKIGTIDGNPSIDMQLAQSELCVSALQEELLLAKPKITVFLTGDFGIEKILYPAVGTTDWRNNVSSEDRIAVKVHPQLGRLLWSYHPRDRWALEHMYELEGFLAGYTAATLY
jgi:hypothetical protein